MGVIQDIMSWLDTFRDIFERGGEKNWKRSIDLVRTDCRDVEKMMDELYLCEYEGGLFNGGCCTDGTS